MEINLDSFVELSKSIPGSHGLVYDDAVRINTKSIGIGPTAMRNLLGDELKSGTSVGITIAYSKEHKALKLTHDQDGYKYVISSAGTGLLNMLPKSFALLKVPQGDYKAVAGYSNIFVLDDTTVGDKTRRLYIDDPGDVEIGDIVIWPFRNTKTGSNKMFLATGEVKKKFKGEGDETDTRLQVYVLSKNWLDTYPDSINRLVTVSASNVIVREKGNAN